MNGKKGTSNRTTFYGDGLMFIIDNKGEAVSYC